MKTLVKLFKTSKNIWMTLTDTGVGDNFEYIRHKQQNKK